MYENIPEILKALNQKYKSLIENQEDNSDLSVFYDSSTYLPNNHLIIYVTNINSTYEIIVMGVESTKNVADFPMEGPLPLVSFFVFAPLIGTIESYIRKYSIIFPTEFERLTGTI